jgi:hypothetical protein
MVKRMQVVLMVWGCPTAHVRESVAAGETRSCLRTGRPRRRRRRAPTVECGSCTRCYDGNWRPRGDATVLDASSRASRNRRVESVTPRADRARASAAAWMSPPFGWPIRRIRELSPWLVLSILLREFEDHVCLYDRLGFVSRRARTMDERGDEIAVSRLTSDQSERAPQLSELLVGEERHPDVELLRFHPARLIKDARSF